MYWLTFFEILGLGCYTAYLINNHCQKDVPLYAQALGIVSWIMNFALIALVPLDIFVTQRNADLG